MRSGFLLTLICFFCYLSPAFSAVDVNSSIKQALNYNPLLQSAQEARQAAKHEVRRARSGYYPTIGLWGNAGFRNANDITARAYNEANKTRATGQTGLSLSQNIWDGGATTALVETRLAAVQSSNSLVEESAINICFAAISAHIDVYRRRIMLDLAIKNVNDHEEIFATVNSRFEQGIASAGEVNQVKSRLARANATRMTHSVGLQAAQANYLRITGIPAPANLAEVNTPQHIFASAQEVKEAALNFNPQIMHYLSMIKSLLGEKHYAQTGFYPKFTLDAGPAYVDKSGPNQNYGISLEAMLRLRWDFYSGGADEAATNAASARIRKARLDLHNIMDVLNEDIESSFTRTQYAIAQAHEFDIAREASYSSGRNFYDQFLAGQRSLLDVLDAGNEAFAAAIETLTYSTDHVMGSYRLLALAGSLLKECQIDPKLLEKFDSLPDTENPQEGLKWSNLNAEPSKKTIKPNKEVN